MVRMVDIHENLRRPPQIDSLKDLESLERLQKLEEMSTLQATLEKDRAKQAQHQGAALAMTATAAVVTVGFMSLNPASRPMPEELSDTALIVAFSVAALALCSALVYFYLRGWVTKVPLSKKLANESDISTLRNRIDALESGNHTPSDNGTSPEGPAITSLEVAQSLLPEVIGELSKLFEERYERKSAEHLAAAANARRFDAAVTRLEREIREQGRKGNVNLAIGLFTTGLAIVLLIAMVLQAHEPFDSTPKVLSHYVPWLSVTVFIEVFSFFFLRLYKATLAEARRYNDDLTRLTLQWVATDTGRFSVEPSAIAALAKDLIEVSKPSKPASVESSNSGIDTDRALKALLDSLSKQLEAKTKKSARREAKDTEED